MLQHRHKVTPYIGRKLHGEVLATYVGGRVVYEKGRIVGAPAGKLLT